MTRNRPYRHSAHTPSDEAATAANSLDDLLVTGRLCTPDEVAEMLRVSTRTLADWRTDRSPHDGLPFLRIGGRVMYLLRDVNDFLLQRVEAAASRRDAKS